MTKGKVNAFAAQWLTSPKRRTWRRRLAETKRRVLRRKHELHYFHRVDDPYCYLMTAVLPGLARRFDVRLVPHLIAHLDARMYPARDELAAFAQTDAARLAQLYALPPPPTYRELDPDVLQSATLALAGTTGSDDFFALAQTPASEATRQLSDGEKSRAARRIEDDEALLKKRGHYLSATVWYAGEWYWGVDRLDHLEERLVALGRGDGVEFDRTFRDIFTPTGAQAPPDAGLELYVSARSPYSYIAYSLAQRFCKAHEIALVIKPVLPMVMRGLPVPLAKRLYIVADAKREAEKAALPFGRIADPLGVGVERIYAVAYRAIENGRLLPWLDSALQAVWAEGVDVATDAGLKHAADRAGLNWNDVRAALDAEEWRGWVAAHRNEMAAQGLWGVPCLRYGSVWTWGQDRFWVIRDAIAAGH